MVIWLKRMNATALATDDAIVLAQLKPTKYLGYLIKAHTAGIADLSYRQTSSHYDARREDYLALSEGTERYYDTYDLWRMIEMRSKDENYTMGLQDRKGHSSEGFLTVPAIPMRITTQRQGHCSRTIHKIRQLEMAMVMLSRGSVKILRVMQPSSRPEEWV